MCHLVSTLVVFVTILFSLPVQGFYSNWQPPYNLQGQLYCARAYDRAVSQIVISPVPANTIWQITSLCKTTNGGLVSPSVCQESVITTGAAFGLAVLYWKQADYWGSINGANRAVRRSAFASTSTVPADDFLSRISAHIAISNVKINNTALVTNTSSSTYRRMKRDAEEYNVYYNGTLPLTFILHHPISSSTTRSLPEEIPIFAATDGQNMYLTHIAPLNTTTSALTKRTGFDGYNYLGTGGIKLQTMSDPIALWSDVMNWLSLPTEQGGSSAYEVMLGLAQGAGWLGHSFATFVHDKQTGKGYNGQWAMAAEAGAFGTDWDPNWDWCWGAYPQNC